MLSTDGAIHQLDVPRPFNVQCPSYRRLTADIVWRTVLFEMTAACTKIKTIHKTIIIVSSWRVSRSVEREPDRRPNKGPLTAVPLVAMVTRQDNGHCLADWQPTPATVTADDYITCSHKQLSAQDALRNPGQINTRWLTRILTYTKGRSTRSRKTLFSARYTSE